MEYKIEMLNITKSFGTLKANDDVTLKVKSGEIHGLLGENGAGKSTLMSILFGLYKQDEGIIKIDGREVNINSPIDANNLKIGMVHQHFKLVPVFTVAESIILGNEPTKAGILNIKECERKINELSKKYQLEVNPKAYIRDLSVGMQQRVEILKMLYRDSDILIFDEPTAVLTPQEIEQLMKIIKNFAANGKTIIIITHKLNEIKEIADRCTVLRKGKSIKTFDVKDTDIKDMAKFMVGHEIDLDITKKEADIKEKIFEAKNLSIYSKTLKKRVVSDISFSINRGEILAIAGVEGNGQSQLVKAIWGIDSIKNEENFYSYFKKYLIATFNFKDKRKLKDKYNQIKEDHEKYKTKKPTIIFKNEDITKKSIRKRLQLGMGHIPEDRHKRGLVLDYPLKYNIILDSYYKKEFSKFGWLKKKKIEEYSDKLIEDYDIRSAKGSDTITRSMSGGNQQKAILAREVSMDPDLLIAVCPTRGLDIGACDYIHNVFINHRDKGKSVLLISYDLDEILTVSDRILVMYNGKIVANLLTKDTNKVELGEFMLGAREQIINEEI